MKITWKKIIIIQFIFFIISSSYIPIQISIDMYLSRHLIPTYSLNFTYDNSVATTLNQLRNKWSDLDISRTIPRRANSFAEFFADGRMANVLSDVILIGFWMIMLNIIFFSFVKAKRFYK